MATVPSIAERSGDFSQSALRPRDPATGQPFPGGIIPASRFDPAALERVSTWLAAHAAR